MSRKNIILAITQGLWLIDNNIADSFGENLAQYFHGKNFWTDDHKSKSEFLIIGSSQAGADSFYSSSLSKAPKGSVAVISMEGPIMKYDNCGDPGTKSYEGMIQEINANPNIVGAVLAMSSGGGTVEGTESLSSTIKNSQKPIVTLAEDVLASAAYWIGSSSQKVIVKTQTTIVGSIGTVSTIKDYTKMWADRGIVIHEVYATASKEKNAAFIEAQKGQYDKLRQEIIDPLNNSFLAAVKANRPGIKPEALTGKTFQGQAIIDMGLADAFGTLQDAIDAVHELANGKPGGSISTQNQQTTHMKKVTLTAAHPAILALCGVTLEAGKDSAEVEMNDELLGKINSALAAGTKASADLSKASTDLTAATEKATGLETKLSEKTKALTDLTAEHETLKKSNPGATGSKKEGDDNLDEGSGFSCEMDARLKADLASIGL